jgi:PAS domain S-box-containing protein
VGKDENVVGIPYSVRLSRSLQQLLLNNVLTNPEERIFVKDLDSKFIFVNQCFLADNGTGLGMDQLIGKTDADLFTNEHAQAARFDEEQVMATRLPILSKLERETFTDRDDKWVTTSKFPLHDDDGTVIGTWGVSRDITKQVQAQLATAEKLQASEGQHRLLFEVWVLDLETQKILAASNAAVSDYGYTREELLQMTYSDLCPPKDAKATNLRRPTGELDTEQADLTCHQYKDGTIIEVEVFGENVILEGRSCRIALT